MTAPCAAAWEDHVLPYSHHCGLDEGHEGLHRCMACAQLPVGRVDAGNRVGGAGAARPEPNEKCERIGHLMLAGVCLRCGWESGGSGS